MAFPRNVFPAMNLITIQQAILPTVWQIFHIPAQIAIHWYPVGSRLLSTSTIISIRWQVATLNPIAHRATRVITPTLQTPAKLATSITSIRRPVQTMLMLTSPLIALHAIQRIRDGNRLHTHNMMCNISPFIQENTMANGPVAMNAILHPEIIHRFHVPIAMNITLQKWTMSTMGFRDTHQIVQPVTNAILPVMKEVVWTIIRPISH